MHSVPYVFWHKSLDVMNVSYICSQLPKIIKDFFCRNCFLQMIWLDFYWSSPFCILYNDPKTSLDDIFFYLGRISAYG